LNQPANSPISGSESRVAGSMADTANRLKSWAEGELGYCGTVSVEDLSKICLGSINNVWSWIVSHCRDRERVKTIHGNLILMKKKVEGRGGVCSDDGSILSSLDAVSSTLVSETERDLLMADRSRLLGEIHAMVVKVQRLKTLHSNYKVECVKLDNQRHEKLTNINMRRRKVVLLGLYFRQISDLLINLQSKNNQLRELFQTEIGKTKTSALISCEKGILTEDFRKVEELIDEIRRMFASILAGDTVHGRSPIRNRVVESLGRMSAVSAARSLIQFTEALGRKTEKQRIEKYPGVELPDCVGDSVKNSVDEMNKHLVSCFATAQTHTASVQLWREKVAVMMKKAGVEGEAVLAIQLSVQKASLASSVADLRSSIAGQNIDFSVLEDLVAMQQKQIDELCTTISSLIPGSSTSSLKMSQLKTLETMSTSLPSQAAELVKLSHGAEDLPSGHLNVLGSAPIWKLSSTNLTGDVWVTMTPTSQLSIHRKKGKLPVSCAQSCSEREDSLIDLIKQLVDISRKEDILADDNFSKRKSEDLHLYEHLTRALQTNIKEQSRNLMPVLDECRKQQQEVRERLGGFEKLHQIWRRQPAAEVAAEETFSWGEVEGKSLKQLQDLVKCYINKLDL